jgi:hypothetical protein
MDAAAWAGRKSETAAPRACPLAIVGHRGRHLPLMERLEPFHLAYAEHREDACSQCCYVNLAETVMAALWATPGFA